MNALVPTGNDVLRRIVLCSSIVSMLVACRPSPPMEKVAADHSGSRARDQSTATAPVDGRSNSVMDIAISMKIRDAIHADESLSVNARNVEIITDAGVVTLRGRVASVAEKVSVGAAAQRIGGVKRVQNDLETAS
jgi:hyperosmotically inducible protein